MEKIRKNDEIIVLAGKDKGKRGSVKKRVDANYVIVQGINVAKKALKPNPAQGITGGIVDKEMPIHISNIAIFNSVSGSKDKVVFKEVDGKKVRAYRSSNEIIKA